MELEPYHVDRLLPWFGYGNFAEADIIFFGNEEGLGGFKSIETAINGRCEKFGRDSRFWIDKNDWSKGYWESSGVVAYQHMKEYAQEIGDVDIPKGSSVVSPMLRYQARMLMSLEESDKAWLDESVDLRKVQDYVDNYLYTDKPRVKSALVDLRPFPSRDEKREQNWKFDNVDNWAYQKVFEFNNLKKPTIAKIPPEYFNWRDGRAKVLATVFERFPAPVIIGIGAREFKKNFFEKYVRDKNGMKPIFTTESLSTCTIYVADISYSNRNVKVILAPFFDDYGKGHIKLEGLKELTERYIRPIVGIK